MACLPFSGLVIAAGSVVALAKTVKTGLTTTVQTLFLRADAPVVEEEASERSGSQARNRRVAEAMPSPPREKGSNRANGCKGAKVNYTLNIEP